MSVRKLVVSLRNAKIKAREVQKSGVYMSVLEHFLDERNADIGVFFETLIKRLNKMGCEMIRHGGKHDIYYNPRTGVSQPVPRHREINEILAKKIIKDLSDT